MASDKFEKKVSITNRRALHDYHIVDTWQAGIALRGTEIKVIRQGRVNLQDAYADMRQGELFLVGLHISLYDNGTYNNHEPLRERKLLLTRRELRKIEKASSDRGMTLVPTKIYINDRGLCKVEIGLAKGKKMFDKRETLKERDVAREIERAMR